MARNPVVVQPAICGACGAKVRAERGRCPRCRTPLTAPDPVAAAASSRKLATIAAGVCVLFALLLGVLWIMRDPVSVKRPAGPVPATRRQPVPAAASAASVEEPRERPFLDPSGAASIAYASGDMAAALLHYQTAVEKNPNDAESMSNLGQVLVRLNRAEEALPYFRRAIAILPERWAYQFNLARALGVIGRWKEAITEYRRAQQLYPDDYVTTFNLGLALHKSGDEAGAIAEYLKAIELDPNEPTFRMALGMSYERLQKPAEAAAAYQEALRLAPEAPDADHVRARIGKLTGSTAAAPAMPGPNPGGDEEGAWFGPV